jgi:hypothetical protein
MSRQVLRAARKAKIDVKEGDAKGAKDKSDSVQEKERLEFHKNLTKTCPQLFDGTYADAHWAVACEDPDQFCVVEQCARHVHEPITSADANARMPVDIAMLILKVKEASLVDAETMMLMLLAELSNVGLKSELRSALINPHSHKQLSRAHDMRRHYMRHGGAFLFEKVYGKKMYLEMVAAQEKYAKEMNPPADTVANYKRIVQSLEDETATYMDMQFKAQYDNAYYETLTLKYFIPWITKKIADDVDAELKRRQALKAAAPMPAPEALKPAEKTAEAK